MNAHFARRAYVKLVAANYTGPSAKERGAQDDKAMDYLCTDQGCLPNFPKDLKNILHLCEFLVISKLRTNFAEMPGKSQDTGSRNADVRETRWRE